MHSAQLPMRSHTMNLCQESAPCSNAAACKPNSGQRFSATYRRTLAAVLTEDVQSSRHCVMRSRMAAGVTA